MAANHAHNPFVNNWNPNMGDQNINPPVQVQDAVARWRSTTYANAGMNRFREAPITMVGNVAPDVFKVPLHSEQVEVHTTTEPAEQRTLVPSLVIALGEEEDPHQSAAHFCAIIANFIPSLLPTIRRTFEEKGIPVNHVTTAAMRKDLGFDIDQEEHPSVSLLLFGQSVLMLYKNLNELNFDNFMRARTNAIRALLGVANNIPDIYVCPLAKALEIKSALGSCSLLKRDLLYSLLTIASSEGVIGSLATYICGILNWHELTALVFIYDTLIITRSPVLRVAEVQGEVRNLYQAYKKINAVRYPQYFKITQPPHETRIVERSRFPILIEVARRIKRSQQPNVDRFVSVSRADNAFINSLVVKHTSSMLPQSTAMDRILDYLETGNLAEDDVETLPGQQN